MTAASPRVDKGLPERASACGDDPHYDRSFVKLSDRIDIILDGTMLDEATSYDIATGEVTVPTRDRDGHHLIHKGAAVYSIKKGRVEVRWKRAGEGAA